MKRKAQLLTCLIFSAKLIALRSDGAPNMVGIRGGLAALLREDINHEMINVHCFAHRLERTLQQAGDIYNRSLLFLYKATHK